MAKYYAQINGAANVLTDFNPYSSYTENGNYMRLEFNGEIYNPVGGRNNGAVWYVNSSGWFSFELYPENWQYMNFGGATYIGRYYDWGTSGFETTTIFEYDNGTATVSKDDQVVTVTYNGSAGRGKMPFFPSTYATNLRMNFYRLRVYGQNDTLLYEFVPYLSGDTKGIYESVEDKFFPASDQTKMDLFSLSVIEVEPRNITAPYSGLSSAITLTIEEGLSWSATTIPFWVSLSSTAGTESAEITATIAKNTTYSQRTGTIGFTASNGDTAEIECTQDKHPLLVPVNNIYKGGLVID